MNITELDKVLINLNVVGGFKNLNSKTELNGRKCELITDYIRDLEVLIECLYHGVTLNDEQEQLLNKVLFNK